jgi:RluA family pseudouridine synthase
VKRRKIQLSVAPEASGLRLDQFLSEQLPLSLSQPLSKSKVRALIVAGAVYLNGKRVRIASKTLINGARLEVHVDLERLGEAPRSFEWGADRILYRDEWVIAVNKPPGIPTQPTLDEARANLFAALKAFLKKEGHADPYVGLHHRLDKDTSGVVIFALRTEANAGLARAFQEHQARKTYQALVAKLGVGRLAEHWQVKNYLGRVNRSGPARYGAVRSGGDEARTTFRLIHEERAVAWVEAQPETGRTHQIRVHLAEDRLPILGDPFYAPSEAQHSAQELGVPRLMLHAERLELPHPVTGQPLAVQAPLPEDFKAVVSRAFPGRRHGE